MNKILIAKDAAEKALAAEFARTELLGREAWRFVAATVVILGFEVRDFRGLVESPSSAVKVLGCVSVAVLSLALCAACYSLQVRGSGHYPRGNRLWENLKPETVSEHDAEEAMVQLLLQTREQNARANDARSRVLRCCGWLFLAGALLVAATQLFGAFKDWS